MPLLLVVCSPSLLFAYSLTSSFISLALTVPYTREDDCRLVRVKYFDDLIILSLDVIEARLVRCISEMMGSTCPSSIV